MSVYPSELDTTVGPPIKNNTFGLCKRTDVGVDLHTEQEGEIPSPVVINCTARCELTYLELFTCDHVTQNAG